MKCNQCGAETPAQATFCPQCGGQLDPRANAPGFQAGGAQGAARNLTEQELWAGSYCPKAMTGPFIGAALLTVIGMIGASFAGPVGWIGVGIGTLLLFGYLGLLAIYRRISERFRLTTQRLIIEKGILSRTGDHTLVINIDDVTVSQGLFERMLNLGKIVLNTKDKTTPTVTMLGIENPRHVADLIDEARRTERNRRGLYTMDA